MVCLHRGPATGVPGTISAIGVCGVSRGEDIIIIAFLLALFAIAADGGLTEEAFQDDPPYIVDELE